MNKKAIIILGAIFLLIVGTLGFLIYTKYGTKSNGTAVAPISSKPTPATSDNSTPGNSSAPAATTTSPSSATKLVKLINTQVISPVPCYNGQGLTYFDPSGQLYQAAFQGGDCQNPAGTGQVSEPLQIGNTKPLGIQSRSDIARVLWPPLGDNFMAEIAANGKKSWTFYNSSTNSYKDLPSQVEAWDWLPSGKQIYYVWLDDKGKATLNLSDGDASNWKYIADMWEQDDAISVSPDGKLILYYEQNTSSSTNPIYSVTPDGKVWKTVISTGVNYGVLWSPDSQKFLFGRRNSAGTGYDLWYYNLMTGETKSLIYTTALSKVVWSQDSKTIYAAVPKNGAYDAGKLSDDFVVRIDTESGNSKQFDTGTTVIDGRDLFLSKDGAKLFFKNAQDGSLYYLSLEAAN